MAVMPRFVVLFHQMPPASSRFSHCDLLLEMGNVLWTWELPQWPPAKGTQAIRLPDHRRLYLDYEGPLTGGRGTVRRLDYGTYQIIAQSHRLIVVHIVGQHHRGRLALEALPGDAFLAEEAQRAWSVGWTEETPSS